MCRAVEVEVAVRKSAVGEQNERVGEFGESDNAMKGDEQKEVDADVEACM